MHCEPLRAVPAATLTLLLSMSLPAAAVVLAPAAGPSIVAGSVNTFRDFRGANSVGVTTGDRIQYGASIVGGSSGVFVGATAATGFVDAAIACAPLTTNPNSCINTTPYSSARLDPWQISFTRSGATTTVTGPSLVGASRIAFPSSVTLSGSGLTPTISWQVPGTTPDAFRVQIFDKNRRLADGSADIIYSTGLAATATSFTLPSNIGLSSNGNYAINFQVIETRNHVAFTNNNAQIFSRSNSFFDFSPLGGSAPSEVALPTIDASGVYNFSVGSVGADHITFIDPAVAVGYQYAKGASDPNFLSLLLPNVGDGIYTLTYTDGSGTHTTTLTHDQQFFFNQGGVAGFTVTGIETSAGLDPADATAFVTGLTFVSAGSFTGTMTPLTVIVAGVPEPATWASMATGLGLLGWARRRREARRAG